MGNVVLVGANLVTATMLAITGTVLVLSIQDNLRRAAVISQGLVQGFSGSVSMVYMYQCLGRGTTVAGRARALNSLRATVD